MTPADKIELFQTIRNIRWRYQLDQFDDKVLKQILDPIHIARNEIVAELEAKIKNPEVLLRNQEILAELDRLTAGVKVQLGEDVAQVAGAAYEQSVIAHNSIMSIGARAVNVSMVQLSGEQIVSFLSEPVGGMLLNDWVQRSFDHPLQDKLKREMQAGLFRGESYRGLARRVDELFGGVESNVDTMIRTWVHSSNVEAQRRVMEANSDLIKGWKWSAVMENSDFSRGTGTCLRCLSLDIDDTLYPINGGPPIPLHPRCRCHRVTVTKTYREMGIPINELDDAVRPYTIRGRVDPRTGQVKRGATGIGGMPLIDAGRINGGFNEFFETLSDQVQRDTLGAGRYQLWKDGKIKLSDLANSRGRQRTIAELSNLKKDKYDLVKRKAATQDYINKKGYPDKHIYYDPENLRSKQSIEQLKKEAGKPILVSEISNKERVPMPRNLKDDIADEGVAWIKDQAKKTKPTTILLKDINIEQEFVFEKPLNKYLKMKSYTDSQIPVIFEWDGKMYLGDGNHRVAAAFLKGDQKIQVKKIHIEAWGKGTDRFGVAPAGSAAGRKFIPKESLKKDVVKQKPVEKIIKKKEKEFFKPAGSVADAVEWAKNKKIAGSFKYTKANIETANVVNKTVDELNQKYGVKYDVIRFVNRKSGDNLSIPASTETFFKKTGEHKRTELVINQAFFDRFDNIKSADDWINSISNSGYWVPKNTNDIIKHEYGHLLTTNKVSKVIKQKDLEPDMHLYVDLNSKYAISDFYESMAEIFTAHTQGIKLKQKYINLFNEYSEVQI